MASFKYFNSPRDGTLSSKNSIKFEFTPPYNPIYVYCALVCYNRNYPSDDKIMKFDNVSDNLTSYYTAMFNTKTKSNIIFNDLVRGQSYKLRCIISSTEGVVAQRTSAAVSIEKLASANGTVSEFIPTSVTKTQCVQYYFTSDPGQATKIAMVNYCQKLFSATGYSTSGCVVCTDSELTYTSPGLELPNNLTCTATTTKSRLRFLQSASTTNNSTVLTPTTASSTVNPSLVNQSNTLIVTDLVAPNISKSFVVQVSSINSNGLIVFNAKFTSALRCSWQIADSSAAPATGSAIAGCTDTQWCGSNFQVGTLVSN